MSKLIKLAGDTVIYGMGSIIPRMLNFLLFPLHTRIFDPAAYGVISYLYVFVAFFNIVYTFGLETAYFRFATKQGANAQRIFNNAQTGVMLISVSLSALFIIFSQPIAVYLHIPDKSQYIILLAIIMFVDAIVAIPFAKLRLDGKALRFVTAKIINVILLLGFNIYFFIIAYWLSAHYITFNFNLISAYIQKSTFGIEYVFIANLVANLFYIIFFWKILLGWRPNIDKKILASMSCYAYPIMLTGLAGMTNEMFSRWTLEWWLPENFYPGKSSMYALGVFSACYKYAVFMSLTIQAFRFAAEPFFFSHANDKNSPELFARVNHYFIMVCSFILLAVSLNLDILKYMLGGSAYYEGLPVVPILLLSYLFLGVYYNFSVWFKLTDKTYFGTIITVSGAILTIVLNYILIPIAGYMGSSWASLICYASMAFVCYLLGQYYYPIPYKNSQDLMYIGFAGLLIWLGQSLTFNVQLYASAVHLCLLLFFLTVCYYFERKELRKLTAETV